MMPIWRARRLGRRAVASTVCTTDREGRALRSALLGVLALLVGCGCGGGPPAPPRDMGTDAHTDSSVVPPDDAGLDADAADAGGQACGSATCGAGEHCCATCPGEPDVCIPQNFDCPVADEFDCLPRDCPAATDVSGAAVGNCDTILGYSWGGSGCVPLWGCSCTGDVCQDLFATYADCAAAHSDCPLCGTLWEIPCEATEYCRHTGPITRCQFLTHLWGLCVPIPDSCDAVSEPVCACDGMTYDNPCLARAAQQTVDHLGACEP